MDEHRDLVVHMFISVCEITGSILRGGYFSRVTLGVQCNPTIIYRNVSTDSATTLVVVIKASAKDTQTCERVCSMLNLGVRECRIHMVKFINRFVCASINNSGFNWFSRRLTRLFWRFYRCFGRTSKHSEVHRWLHTPGINFDCETLANVRADNDGSPQLRTYVVENVGESLIPRTAFEGILMNRYCKNGLLLLAQMRSTAYQ